MLSLILLVYLILIVLVTAFVAYESTGDKTFFKTVLSDLEYKIITSIIYIIFALLLLPVFCLWITDLQNGKPIAYVLAFVYTLIIGTFVFEQIKTILQKIKIKKLKHWFA